MKWQITDWFFGVIFLVVVIVPFFFGKHFVGHGRRGAVVADACPAPGSRLARSTARRANRYGVDR